MSDLCTLTDTLHSTLLAIHQEVDGLDTERVFLDGALTTWTKLADVARLAGQVRDEFAAKLAGAMPEKRMTVTGVGTFEKHRKSSRTRWEKDDLLRAVLDTRLADPESGELREETETDKILDVWSLGAPRLGALRARGLDPDEFCSVERGAMTLEVIANG